jgi:hypothetical protein
LPGFLETAAAPVRVAGALVKQAQGNAGIQVVGADPQNIAVESFGAGKISGLVGLQGCLEQGLIFGCGLATIFHRW